MHRSDSGRSVTTLKIPDVLLPAASATSGSPDSTMSFALRLVINMITLHAAPLLPLSSDYSFCEYMVWLRADVDSLSRECICAGSLMIAFATSWLLNSNALEFLTRMHVLYRWDNQFDLALIKHFIEWNKRGENSPKRQNVTFKWLYRLFTPE